MLDNNTEKALYTALGVDPAAEAAQHDLEAALATSIQKRNIKLTWLGGILLVIFSPLLVIVGIGLLCSILILGCALIAGLVCLPFFPVLFGMGTMRGSGR